MAADEQKIADAGVKYGDNLSAQRSVVKAFNQLGDYDKAKPFADRAVDLAEKNGNPKLMEQAHVLRGDVNFGRKDYAAALKDAEAALKIDPKDKAALSLKYQAAGRLPGGAGTVTMGSGGAATGGGNGAAEGAARGGTPAPSVPTMAAIEAQRAAAVVTMTPQKARTEALIREAAQRMRIDPAAALPFAEKAVQSDPNDPRAYFTRAAARRAAGDLAGAMSDLDRTLALDPNDAAAHGAKASAAIALRRPLDEVKKEFLASGRAAADFADYYRDQVAALTGQSAAAGTAGAGGSAPGGPWAAGGGLPARIRENAGALILLGLGLAVFGGALLWRTRKSMGDERRDG